MFHVILSLSQSECSRDAHLQIGSKNTSNRGRFGGIFWSRFGFRIANLRLSVDFSNRRPNRLQIGLAELALTREGATIINFIIPEVSRIPHCTINSVYNIYNYNVDLFKLKMNHHYLPSHPC